MNKNKYGFEPAKIKIKDFKKYTDIAFIIDSPIFIKEAKKIRKKYGISKPFGLNNYQHWLITNLGKKTIRVFYKKIKDLRMSMGLETNYQDVFEKAVLGCEITDVDYVATQLINFSKLPSFVTYKTYFIWAILITSQTKKKDVLEAFGKYKEAMRKVQASPDTHYRADEYNKIRKEVDRDRKWYWKVRKGMTYRQIARQDGISGDDFNRSVKDLIVKAVKAYRKNLF